ncbi:MAG: flavin reductase family protein [Halobacteriovoraceae bacterium]|jgi:flavin reductase (DIM6/NTAB) family NADH-FMN oxidoreductase RutF|nr:flavin reductase family protein [Halobacteriovoraceae bacterium]
MSDIKEEVALALGHIPTGLFVISSITDNIPDAYLASWMQQISFEPLLISFAIKKDRPGYNGVISGNPFTINIVAEESSQYMRHFWSGYEKNPFSEIKHTISKNGGLIITEALSTIECKFISKSSPGDHEIIVAEVFASYVNNESFTPKVHTRKSGLKY